MATYFASPAAAVAERVKVTEPDAAYEYLMLGLRLAGDAWYHGVLHKKDYIGDAKREIELEDIPRAGRLMYLTAVLALVVFGAGKALLIVL